MKFVVFPVTYTRVKRAEGTEDSSYRAVLRGLNIPEEEDDEGTEVQNFMYIQKESLRNVIISPVISPEGEILKHKSLLEFGQWDDNHRVVLVVEQSVASTIKALEDV